MRARQGEEATTVSDTKTEVHRKGTQGSVSPEVLRQIYVTAVRSRVLDERIWVLNRQGRAPFWISGMGHEVFQSAVGTAVDSSKDWLAPYYRDLALTLAFGMSPKDHFLSALAKADDPNSGGRQMPAHFGNREHNIVSTGSPVATSYPAALASSSERPTEAICGEQYVVLVTCIGSRGNGVRPAMCSAATMP